MSVSRDHADLTHANLIKGLMPERELRVGDLASS